MAAPRDSLRLELACFAALAAFAVLEWTSLVADPPTLRALLVVAIATGAGLALAALGRVELSRTARLSVIVALALATVALAMVAIGLPAELLLPGHWDELSAKLGRTLPGVGDVSTPYRGADGWTRLTILLAAPLTVVLAALAAFWPARRRFLGRLAALALLITLYVTAVASTTPGGELGRGLLLVILICAWLWLPGLAARRRGAGLLAIAAASAIALPLAALAPSRPLLDYRSWELLSTDAISFDWDHSYGPLDWPQRGSLLFQVASDGAHYWKATNLDSFDGVVWRRSDSAAPEPPLGNVETLVGTGQLGGGAGPHPEWVDQINFEVRRLSSDVAIGAGTSLGVRGLVGSPTPDATWELSRGLRRGASYTVLAYTPEPSAAQMQAAPAAFPAAAGRYTAFSLPSGAGYVQAPFWRPDQDAALASRLAGSPYETTYDLARQVTTGAATPYEAARRLELYLRATYEYDQDPGEHTYPLPAFLFEDRRGYCQQFSGAMALMLRMIGIPSRVASGFSPGGRDPQRGLFLVEDIDAHSWVEVYFTGIGWVPFEPTPAAAPAEAQLDDNAIGDTAGGPTFSSGETDPAPSPDAIGGDTAAAKPQPQPLSDRGGGSGPGAGRVAGAAAVGIAIVLAGGYGLRSLRRRRLDPEALGERELNELVRALARLDRPLPAGATLLEAELRLEQLAGPEAGGYASALRERRYRLPSASPPGIAERRGLRRALLAASGWRRALAVLLAISPGGPAGRRH